MLKTMTMAVALALSCAAAQTASPTLAQVSGVVKDAASGAPIKDATVSIRISPKALTATTDSEGRYALRDVPPGPYSITAQMPSVTVRTGTAMSMTSGPSATRRIALTPGQDLSSFDFKIQVERASVSGKVLDENGEPAAGIAVRLVERRYQRGAVYHVFTGQAETNDRGEYTINASAGSSFLVRAGMGPMRLDAISAAPADPKLRKKTAAPAYFPNATTVEGGELVTLRPGEHREGVNIRTVKSTPYCIDGTLLANGASAPLNFEFAEARPSYISLSTYSTLPNGRTGADGKFRFCDLHPGQYRLTAAQVPADRPSGLMLSSPASALLATALVTIADDDIHDFRLAAGSGPPLSGEAVLDGEAPEKPLEAKITVRMQQIDSFARASADLSSIPGQFSFPGLWTGDYAVTVSGIPAGFYVKDVTYGGNVSVLYDILRFGTIPGAGLRLVVGRNPGSLSAKAADKDGNPIPDAWVYLMPGGVASETDLSARLVSGQTDQNGDYSSGATLAPGKYLVLASDSQVRPESPEGVRSLWQRRTAAKEVEIGPGGAAQVRLDLTGLD